MNRILLIFLSITFSYSGIAGVGESKFNHEIWDVLLAEHVSSAGNVDYDGFAADRNQLETYLDKLSKHEPTELWTKHEKMAYWINAYNAFTIQLILDNMPIKSIMEINGGKAWDLKFIKIGSKTLSLNNIEHDILRAKYKDPRIHFAVNCASVSCPKIKNSAFTANELENQLNQMAKSFINNSDKNSLSPQKIEISKLFDWYKDDFIKTGSVIDYLNKFSSTKVNSNASISFKTYNWNLNK